MTTEEVLEVFKYFDTSGDMRIPISEIGKCLRALGHTPTEQQIEALTKTFENKEERITVEEFMPILNDLITEQKQTKQFRVADFVEMFAQMDREGSGRIKYTDLKHILTTIGERLSDSELEKTLFGFVNDDGFVEYEKYVKRMCDIHAQF